MLLLHNYNTPLLAIFLYACSCHCHTCVANNNRGFIRSQQPPTWSEFTSTLPTCTLSVLSLKVLKKFISLPPNLDSSDGYSKTYWKLLNKTYSTIFFTGCQRQPNRQYKNRMRYQVKVYLCINISQMTLCWSVFLSLIVRNVAVLGAGLMGAGIAQVS